MPARQKASFGVKYAVCRTDARSLFHSLFYIGYNITVTVFHKIRDRLHRIVKLAAVPCILSEKAGVVVLHQGFIDACVLVQLFLARSLRKIIRADLFDRSQEFLLEGLVLDHSCKQCILPDRILI